jgi:hypothetical protein
MLPPEKVAFGGQPDESEHLIFAEVTSFGGNSGSPVFLKLGPLRVPQIPGALQYYLLGVMQGFFGAPNLPQNSGIAAIIPAEEISKITQSPGVEAYRLASIAGFFASKQQNVEAEAYFKKASALVSNDPTQGFIFEHYAAFLQSIGRAKEASAVQLRRQELTKFRKPAESILLSTNSLCFPQQTEQTGAQEQELKLTNNLEQQIKILSISIIGSLSFHQTNSCGDRIEPQKSCAIKVAFLPIAHGVSTGSLMVTYEDAKGKTRRTVDLAGSSN